VLARILHPSDGGTLVHDGRLLQGLCPDTAGHAQKLFLEPYAGTWIPAALLWPLGVTIPFVELLGGALLIGGWLRRPVAVALGFLLVLVTYGHALKEPSLM